MPGALASLMVGARRVRHRARSRLLALVVAAVVHDAGDGIRTLARVEGHREREDAAAVVRAAGSRTRRSASRLPISPRDRLPCPDS